MTDNLVLMGDFNLEPTILFPPLKQVFSLIKLPLNPNKQKTQFSKYNSHKNRIFRLS